MLNMQENLQRRLIGISPSALEGNERAVYIRNMVLALTDELHEALRETGWKPWSTKRHLNRDPYVDELVDAFHFFMNLMLVAGVSWEELETCYKAKNHVNFMRADSGTY